MNPLKAFGYPVVQGDITDVLTEDPVIGAEVGLYQDGILIASGITNGFGHYSIDLLGVSPQEYPIAENPAGDIKIYNNNGGLTLLC